MSKLRRARKYIGKDLKLQNTTFRVVDVIIPDETQVKAFELDPSTLYFKGTFSNRDMKKFRLECLKNVQDSFNDYKNHLRPYWTKENMKEALDRWELEANHPDAMYSFVKIPPRIKRYEIKEVDKLPDR